MMSQQLKQCDKSLDLSLPTNRCYAPVNVDRGD